jgi:hypothetical protein
VHSLGRRVDHDERSRSYQARLAAKPVNVLWPHRAPVLDQGQLGSCTGNALTQLLNTSCGERARRAGMGSNRYLTETAAVRLYSRATALDELPGQYPPIDSGSSGLAVCKAAVQSRFFTRYDHAFGFDQFTHAIALSPVITGTTWWDGMFDVDNSGYVWPTGRPAGGHEYAVLGYDPAGQGKVTILNSWGPGWGRSGRAYLRGDVYADLLADQGDVTVPALP